MTDGVTEAREAIDAIVARLQGENEGPLSDAGVADLVQFVLGLTRRELYGE